MNNQIRVSVVVPCYNHAKFIGTRINSILSQSYRNFEIIILDDCSTDDSREVIETFRNNPMVSNLVFNSKNSGSTFVQWNKGISMAKGELIWIAESDDSASTDFLEKCVSVFNGNPDLAVCYTQSLMIDNNDNVTGNLLWWTNERDEKRWLNSFVNKGADEVRCFMAFQNTIMNASSALFRKQFYLECGGAPEYMKLCGDWVLWMKLSILGDVAYIAEPLNRYRFHNTTVRSSTERNSLVFWETQDARHTALQLTGYSSKTYQIIQNRIVSEWKNYLLSDGYSDVLNKYFKSFFSLLKYYNLLFLLKMSMKILFGRFAGNKNGN